MALVTVVLIALVSFQEIPPPPPASAPPSALRSDLEDEYAWMRDNPARRSERLAPDFGYLRRDRSRLKGTDAIAKLDLCFSVKGSESVSKPLLERRGSTLMASREYAKVTVTITCPTASGSRVVKATFQDVWRLSDNGWELWLREER